MRCNSLVLLTLALHGCGPGGGQPDLATSIDLGDLAVPVADGPVGPAVAGLVVDEAGAPLADLPVLACTAKVCVIGKSGSDGRFVMQVPDPGPTAVKTIEDDKAMPRRAAAITPVVVADRQLDVGTLYVPKPPTGAAVGPPASDPQVLAVGDGLTLTLRAADVMAPLGFVANSVAARSVALSHVPPLPALGAEQLVAVWAICPFGTQSSSPIAVRAPTTLPAGTEVHLRTISELDGSLSPPVVAHSDGSFVTSDVGTGVSELTWLVISR